MPTGSSVERGSAQLYDVAARPSSLADNGGMGKPNAVEKSPISGYKYKKDAVRLDAVDTGSLPAKRRKSTSEGSSGKTRTGKQNIQVNDAYVKLGIRAVRFKNNWH